MPTPTIELPFYSYLREIQMKEDAEMRTFFKLSAFDKGFELYSNPDKFSLQFPYLCSLKILGTRNPSPSATTCEYWKLKSVNSSRHVKWNSLKNT